MRVKWESSWTVMIHIMSIMEGYDERPWMPVSIYPTLFITRQEYWSGLPFSSSRGSSWPRDRTCISCVFFIAGRFFTCWAMRLGFYLIAQRCFVTYSRVGMEKHSPTVQPVACFCMAWELRMYFTDWGKIIKRRIFCDMEKLHDIKISVPKNGVSSKHSRIHLFTLCL